MSTSRHTSRSSAWFGDADFDADAFRQLVTRETDPADVPLAIDIQGRIPIYDGAMLHAANRDPARRKAVLDEFGWALGQGPGVIAVKHGLDRRAHRLDDATAVFVEIIAAQHAAGNAIGDHFAKPGSNDRIWNSHEKLAERAPDVFAAYYSADVIALGCEAWLGPHYQISAQVNRVNPGGTAQVPHRDYHVGFYTEAEMSHFPRQVQVMSQRLTLQGAVAHTDMPLETGPTMVLPFSQLWDAGFPASYRDDFRAVFHDHFVQLPLEAGDVVFFSPAVFHAAGANVTPNRFRINNLLQVSSAFGRTMETMNTDLTALAVYPHLLAIDDERTRENVISAACAGYAFPTNLDFDKPIGGLAPASQADDIRRALTERWPIDRVRTVLAARAGRRRGLGD
jgi:ectoine hydroxylase-related dioxygenase (phytanoyl-CoA dioxygenase family)